MLLLLTSLFACTDYGFGSEPVVGTDGSGDTDVTATGDGDTDPTNDTDSGDGTVGDDTDPTDDTDPGTDTDTGTDTDPPDIPTDDDCDIAVDLDGWLDQFQVAGDGRVYYCHAGSGNYTMVESNIDSCIKHLDHEWDVFPSTLCDS
jgi:hypothetical protein